MFAAWREFKIGKRRKQDVVSFSTSLEDLLFSLQSELASGQYRPDSYHSFYVRDPKVRHIHKATVRDRIVHQAVSRQLYHVFDRHFIFDSYACRLDKGTHRGVRRLRQFASKVTSNYSQPAYALKCDIQKFFQNIDHDILISLLQQRIFDKRTLALLEVIIKSYEYVPRRGLPLGNVTSQLLANLYLNELDQFVKHRLKQKYYIRYCDDFIFLDQSEPELQSLIKPLAGFLQCQLKLQLHPKKVVVRKLSAGLDFLGYVILPHHTVLRTRTKQRMMRNMERLRQEVIAGAVDKDYYEIVRRSYAGMLSHCQGHTLCQRIQ